mmetsp:Transcript_44460/g.102739  ORF Transcript_44460/g.102739 Transcript_44460/m.102739 type:complete len:223 (-) Transcript_44460:364-1032(-)
MAAADFDRVPDWAHGRVAASDAESARGAPSGQRLRIAYEQPAQPVSTDDAGSPDRGTARLPLRWQIQEQQLWGYRRVRIEISQLKLRRDRSPHLRPQQRFSLLSRASSLPPKAAERSPPPFLLLPPRRLHPRRRRHRCRPDGRVGGGCRRGWQRRGVGGRESAVRSPAAIAREGHRAGPLTVRAHPRQPSDEQRSHRRQLQGGQQRRKQRTLRRRSAQHWAG